MNRPPLRLALDARKLFDGGIGTYIRGLSEGWAHDAQAPSGVALVSRAHAGRMRWSPGLIERTVDARPYGLAEHWRVPAAARVAGANVLHEPHYTFPWGWSGAAVVTVHDLIHLRFPAFFPPGAALYARLVAGAAVARADVVLTISEFTRRDLVERLGASPERVVVTPLAVGAGIVRPDDATLTAFRDRHGLPTGYVLYVGARKRHKNLERLLQAWAAIPVASRPELVMAGPPWAAEHPLARLAHALGVESRVRFVEASDDATLSALYAGAGLLVQPSLCEGFGLPPLEASDAGARERRGFAPGGGGGGGRAGVPARHRGVGARDHAIARGPGTARHLHRAGASAGSRLLVGGHRTPHA
jgi:glycosyltransferase involved in cell wall biosynthesis